MVREQALKALQRVEQGFDRLFGASLNPWRQLGALSFLFFWVVAGTGLVLFIFFDTSLTGAHRSVEALTRQWYWGGLMRSLHRYASDAMVLTMVLHLLREFLYGRYRGVRWFSWITGVPLLWLVFASGINGYWLVWDQLAHFIAVGTAEWLDWLPLFGGVMIRNFLTPESLSDRFFSLLVFLHVGIPLILLLMMWVHIQRISRPKTNPPRLLAGGTLAMLLVLSLALPAQSQLPADPLHLPEVLQLDWFYLYAFPLLYTLSPGGLWGLAAAGTALLGVLPWVGRRPPQPVAEVHLESCNGCGRCFEDCPYAAVVMQPRADGRPFQLQPVVNADLCAACGICAGACPSSTPFRSVASLATGIDMPQMPIDDLRERLEQALPRLAGEAKVVAWGCRHGVRAEDLAEPGVAGFDLLCAGMLPPSFVEYAVRHGADGVLLVGCAGGDCEFRLGCRWTEERMAAQREPHLRGTVPAERVRIAWVNDAGELRAELAAFRERLKTLQNASRSIAEPIVIRRERRHG